jgi:NAD(P)H-hydrate epimerase
MTEELAETEAGTISLRALEYGRMDQLMKGKTVLAIGPGISRNPESSEFVRPLVQTSELPVVLDADGLNAFEDRAEQLDGSHRTLVLTPHPGEMSRLTGIPVSEIQKDRIAVARRFAREHNCILVLKGNRTLIADASGTAWVNTTGNPGMATGGTGDVLTGMVAGLLAQHRDKPLYSVLAAVHLHGLAGDLACRDLGEQAMIAGDLITRIAEAFAIVGNQDSTAFTMLKHAARHQLSRC